MSVRAKIDEFEERCRATEDSKDNRNERAPGKRKRFAFPGKNLATEQQESSLTSLPSGPGLSRSSSKHHSATIAGFEADLQDIWSVRKNIHHTGKKPEGGSSSSTSSSQVTAGQYSRHGAIPAQQSQGAQILGPSRETLGKSRNRRDEFTSFGQSQLQEHNSKDSPWNVRNNIFSYSESLRPEAPPHKSEEHSPPTAKRKTNLGTMDVIKPTGDRVVYAKKMADGYLRSEGLGKYTPSVGRFEKEKSASPERENITSTEPKASPQHHHSTKQTTTRSTAITFDTPTTSKAGPAPQTIPSPTPQRKTSIEAMDTHVPKASNEKLQYAKRMAQGYQRSEGLGKYTPGEVHKERSASPEIDHLAAFESSLKEPAPKKSPTHSTTTKPVASPSHKIQESPSPAKSKISSEAMDSKHHVEKDSNEKRLYAKRMAQRYLQSEGMGEYAGMEKSGSPEGEEKKSEDTHAPKAASERLSYAKRMAQGYLRSEGLGKFTPPKGGSSSSSSPEKKSSSETAEQKGQKWKKSEDEFDF